MLNTPNCEICNLFPFYATFPAPPISCKETSIPHQTVDYVAGTAME